MNTSCIGLVWKLGSTRLDGSRNRNRNIAVMLVEESALMVQ